jgi:hypothetical protein
MPSIFHVAVLWFAICAPCPGCQYEDGSPKIFTCEDGWLRAASCTAAEAFLRAGLRPGQFLVRRECREP